MIMHPNESKYQEMFNRKPWLPGEFITDEEFPRHSVAYSSILDATICTTMAINKMMEGDYV